MKALAELDWPTPLLVYVESDLQKPIPPEIRCHYALKSCYRPSVLQALRRLGHGVEVMSELEWQLARAAGWSGEDIIVNGLGRSPEFLRQVCADGNWVVVDSLADLERIPREYPRLGVRLKDPYYTRDSKLGLTGADRERVLERRPPLFHVHIASQERDARVYLQALELIPDQAEIVDLGGGFDSELPAEFFPELLAGFRARFGDRPLWIEPGRYLVNSAGYLLTTVLAQKDGYLVVDAGTNTMMPHKEASYRLLHPAPGPLRYTLVDGITSLSSVLLRDCGFAEPPRVGDRLLLGNCGAYTSAMAQFWAFPPIPVAFLNRAGELQWDLSPEQLRECRRLYLGA